MCIVWGRKRVQMRRADKWAFLWLCVACACGLGVGVARWAFVACGRFMGHCARLCALACAFPLGWLCGLIFSLVLRFRAFVGVFVRVRGLNAITDDF